MRYWQFGLFDANAADIHFDSWEGFRSQLAAANNTTDQEAGVFAYNGTDFSTGYTTGLNPLQYATLAKIMLDQIKAKLGQIPVLLRVDFAVVPYSSLTNHNFRIWRMYTGWDEGDSSNRYRDRSGLDDWYGDAYAPFPGQDRSTVAFYESGYQAFTIGTRYYLPITAIVAQALRDNTHIGFYIWGQHTDGATALLVNAKPTLTVDRPTLEFYYMFPIEFFESTGGNEPDYASNISETEDGHYYLGAVERGATGSPVQGWIRNFTTTDKQVEIFDDHPEWVDPVQRAGTGTGKLDFVTLAENSTSQLYTVVFDSSTTYEVKAEAYRDNAIGYHPQIDANGSWRSDVNSTWASPSGGLTLTAAMWQGLNISSGDEFEIGVRGNTTDESWAADSNDQVEITFDDTGSPGTADNTEWRPILGHRERATAGVTIDAASKFFPLRHLVPADWSVGDPCYIHDATNYDAGTLTSVQERSLAAETFTGSGLDDCTISGNFNGNADHDYRVVIDATGATDTFSWSRTGDATYIATGVNCSTSPVLLENGVYVTFGAITGHTVTDRWDSAALTWGLTIGSLSISSNAYNSGAYVAQTLPIRDLEPADWSTVDADSGASESPASRVYVADTTPFTQGDVIYLQQVASGGTNETATIATGGVQTDYLDLTTSLLNDYTPGDFVTVKGTGERAFWARPVANSTTVEELKRLRFNARIL